MTFATWITFAVIAFGFVLTPGPNYAYIISRSITQGRTAGFISMFGVAWGYVIYMLCAAFGLTAVLLAVPYGYEAIQYAGAAYLLYLGWEQLRPGARSFLEVPSDLKTDGPLKLFTMGLLTNLLNPKIAVFYLSLLPQFVDREAGNVFAQFVLLGMTHIVLNVSTHVGLVLAAGSVSAYLAARPMWLKLQRWLMGCVLVALAVRLALERRPV